MKSSIQDLGFHFINYPKKCKKKIKKSKSDLKFEKYEYRKIVELFYCRKCES
jgi:hypothetical protein